MDKKFETTEALGYRVEEHLLSGTLEPGNLSVVGLKLNEQTIVSSLSK